MWPEALEEEGGGVRGIADFEMDDEQRHEGTSTHFSLVASRDKTHLVRGREGSRGESCATLLPGGGQSVTQNQTLSE